MRRVATQLSDATVLMNSMRGNLSRVSSLDGARNPDESLREVKEAIASGNHLLAILDDLRSRYVGACLAKDKRSTNVTEISR